ncbi:helix-turn-helix transcriptional regulator [Sphingobium aromaticiconvertens]|uniref:response regulator transcription factor n=1 Tax=Sphingobium aromaticiconvertens TaxID=365341 RepID=UPI003017E4EE
MSRYTQDSIKLTGREHEVLGLVALGLSAKEAAIELAIAPCTVERHIENVRLKTRTRNRAHMIAHVIQQGLLISEIKDKEATSFS